MRQRINKDKLEDLNKPVINEFSGGFIQKFQDPAMDTYVTVQSLNQTCEAFDDVQDKLQNKVFLVIDLLLGIISTYFFSIKNWMMTLIILIILEVIILIQMKKLLRYKKELHSLIGHITKICKAKKIPLPSRAL